MRDIEDSNKAKLHNVFRNIDFNSESNLGKTRQRNERLKTMLDDFNSPEPIDLLNTEQREEVLSRSGKSDEAKADMIASAA